MQTFNRWPFILASGSPRRRELLERFWGPSGIQVMVPAFDEASVMDARSKGAHAREVEFTDPRMLVNQLAAGKMQALRNQYDLPDRYAALAADTVVVLDEHVLGKPADRADATRMLQLLSGRTHQVITGLCLDVACEGKIHTIQANEVTDVRFARLTDQQIDWYTATGEPMDKAGAYGIQGYGAALVKQIDGCYYNVMGLPVNRLMGMLQQAADHFRSSSDFNQLLPWC
jgi:septum formation protein